MENLITRRVSVAPDESGIGPKRSILGTPLRRWWDGGPIWPDVRTGVAAGRTDKGGLDVGQPDVIRPSISIEGDGMPAAIIAAIDQHAAHAGGAHLGKGDLLDGVGHALLIPPIGPDGKPLGIAFRHPRSTLNSRDSTHADCLAVPSRMQRHPL